METEVRSLDRRTFTYRVPEALRNDLEIGMPVMVPFGRQPAMTGYVVGFSEKAGDGFKVREISDVLDDAPLFSLDYLNFLDWVARYYAAPLHQVLGCALPANMLKKIRREVALSETAPDPARIDPGADLSPDARRLLAYLGKRRRAFTPRYLAQQLRLSLKNINAVLRDLRSRGFVSLQTRIANAPAPRTVKHVRLLGGEADTARQREVLDFLKSRPGPVPKKDVETELGVSASTLKKLAEKGAVAIEDVEVVRDPLEYYRERSGQREWTLTDEQRAVVERVTGSTETAPFLLFGVTGSGKTEVYMSLAEQTLAQGRAVLVLVPEIALTSQIARRFVDHFGAENIALWHSNLSEGERADTWRRLMAGGLRIVIGARSAIFAPLQNLGLIVIDEEHDGSYKQESPAPRYHARTLAEELARRHDARLVLGSATPDIGSFRDALESGRLLRLRQRFGGRSLATVSVVDMRNERRRGQRGVLSSDLKEALQANLDAGEQSLVLINRRGFHTLIQCTECGHVVRCPKCDVSLTYHRAENQARCHHCGYNEPLPQFCTQCASSSIVQAGTGSQRVEEEIRGIFPDARIARLDSDVMQRKDAYREVIDRFAAGEADILVGTQMVAKGLDIPNVTLVGVINADSSFYLPDYRSAERGFQLLTQVAGRSGRGEKPGRVILQTMDPNHAVIQYSGEQDYEAFFAHEIMARENLLFPPFSRLFRFIASGTDEDQTRRFADALVAHLKNLIAARLPEGFVQVLGPAPCIISRLQGKYRYHCLAKNLAGEEGHKLVTAFFREVTPPETVSLILDVDSQSLL